MIKSQLGPASIAVRKIA